MNRRRPISLNSCLAKLRHSSFFAPCRRLLGKAERTPAGISSAGSVLRASQPLSWLSSRPARSSAPSLPPPSPLPLLPAFAPRACGACGAFIAPPNPPRGEQKRDIKQMVENRPAQSKQGGTVSELGGVQHLRIIHFIYKKTNVYIIFRKCST